MPKIAFICPTYNHFIYAKEALLTFFQYSPPDSIAIVVDDASPEWGSVDWDKFYKDMPRDRVKIHRFNNNGGLTRSWNKGLVSATEQKATYTICGNADILFTYGWYQPLVYQLEKNNSVKMVGPLSNAAGVTAKGKQDIGKYYPEYKNNDSQPYIDQVAEHLRNTVDTDTAIESGPGVNGFFLFAKTETYWEHRFDKKNCFKPRNETNSKGHKNPTPTMTLNEDELQRRWRKKGAVSAVVPQSFIFHYRSVSRGKKFRKGGWYTLTNR